MLPADSVIVLQNAFQANEELGVGILLRDQGIWCRGGSMGVFRNTTLHARAGIPATPASHGQASGNRGYPLTIEDDHACGIAAVVARLSRTMVLLAVVIFAGLPARNGKVKQHTGIWTKRKV